MKLIRINIRSFVPGTLAAALIIGLGCSVSTPDTGKSEKAPTSYLPRKNLG